MEQNINKWPSSRVAQGGLFHPPKVTYSKETHDLIKLLMEEQKMSIFQRKKIEYHLRNGSPLPVNKQPAAYKMTTTKCRSGIDFMHAKAARRRTLAAIRASGALEYEKYVPKISTSESCERQKIRLQEKMSGIKHVDDDPLNGQESTSSNPSESNEINPVDELLNEIQERAEWLNEMEGLGEGKKYKQLILNEIAERLRLIKEYEKDNETA